MPLALLLLAPKAVFMILLVRPETVPTHTPVELEAIQAGHMAHLGKLGKDGVGLIAGPFEDGGRYRGLVVLKANSIEAARALCGDDPAVEAGRLAIEAYPWRVRPGAFTPYVEGAKMHMLTTVFAKRGGPERGALLSGRSGQGFSAISILPPQPPAWRPKGDKMRLDWYCAKGILPGDR